MENIRNVQVHGHIGFDCLPYQLVNATVMQKSFAFNILVVGETGIGKSTLIDSLFNLNPVDSVLSSPDVRLPSSTSTTFPHNFSSVDLVKRSYELNERGVKLNLTVLESKGYGDQLNKEGSFDTILGYIDEQNEAYFREELRIERCLQMYLDTRIHACIFLINPNGLKAVDLTFMKILQHKVNIIPAIGKSDALTKVELPKFKENIMKELKQNAIRTYNFPLEDEEFETSKAVHVPLPFAVVGSQDFFECGNKLIRGRMYPWGVLQVENEEHCDFIRLRETLIRTNMMDLKETTHQIHYENYRMKRLIQMGFSDDDGESFQEMLQQKLHFQFQELVQKEMDVKQRVMAKIKDKETELKKIECEVYAKHSNMKEQQQYYKNSFEEAMNLLDNEMGEFRELSEQYWAQQQQPQKKLSGSGSTSSFYATIGKLKKLT